MIVKVTRVSLMDIDVETVEEAEKAMRALSEDTVGLSHRFDGNTFVYVRLVDLKVKPFKPEGN